MGGLEPGEPWWRDAVIYEIYVRSFADADGDGLGDLAGVRSRLPALADLGVDAIWLTPFYPSPLADGGYDVAEYCDVDARLGSLAEVDALLATAHDLGLRVLVDIVPNHTSEAHAWFRAALADGPGAPSRDRYLFRAGRGTEGAEPPNDWRSVFGGPAWTRITEADGTPGPWYLHLFDSSQPDLDWSREEVRAAFDDILRFWLDRGVDGFRIDVAHGLAKDPSLPDIDGRFARGGVAEEGHPHWDRDEVHDVYRRWRRVINGYDRDRVFVAEAYLGSARRLAQYVRPDELHTAFNFDLLLAPWDAEAFRTAVDDSIDQLAEVGATPTWVLSNHDMVRHLTRYGGGDEGERPGPRRDPSPARAPGRRVPLPRRRARPARGDRPPRRDSAGPHLPPHEGPRAGTGRLPRADPLGRRAAVLRLRSRRRLLAAPARRLGPARPSGAGGRSDVDAVALSRRPTAPSQAARSRRVRLARRPARRPRLRPRPCVHVRGEPVRRPRGLDAAGDRPEPRPVQ